MLMADEGHGPDGAEFDEAPFKDSDESGEGDDDHEFGGKEEEDGQSVD